VHQIELLGEQRRLGSLAAPLDAHDHVLVHDAIVTDRHQVNDYAAVEPFDRRDEGAVERDARRSRRAPPGYPRDVVLERTGRVPTLDRFVDGRGVVP
jgi:hypothetical protein